MCIRDSVNPISMEQLKKVINYLSRVLGVPMEKADVLVVDIAENFVMEKSPELYIEKMRNLGTVSYTHLMRFLSSISIMKGNTPIRCFK